MDFFYNLLETLSKPIIGPINGFHVVIVGMYLLLQLFKSGGDKIQASHILVPTEEDCNKLKGKIAEGQKFEDLAAEFSKCPSGKSGGDLGLFGKGAMVPEFDSVCFDPSVEVGDVVGPVKTQFGYHLIKITGRPENSSDSKKK